MDIQEIINYENIYKSMMKCKGNVLWKDSVASFYLNGIEKSIILKDQLIDNTYKPRRPLKFFITSPKRREIISTSFRDRVYQRTLNDLNIYPVMTKSFILDNWSCQIGKGTDKARERLKEFIRKEYRHNGPDGYCLKIDIKGYYPNMKHSFIENMFLDKLEPDIGARAVKVLSEQYDGDTGYNPGSQLVQIAGISALNPLDHYVKEVLRAKFYLRYMDDMLIIHHDKDVLINYLNEIKKHLSAYEFTVNLEKTKIYALKDGFEFLGFKFRLTDTGKVLMTLNSENIKKERRKLKRASKLVKKGILRKEKVDEMYVSWRAHASKGNSYKLLRRMDEFYASLWR